MATGHCSRRPLCWLAVAVGPSPFAAWPWCSLVRPRPIVAELEIDLECELVVDLRKMLRGISFVSPSVAE